LFRNTIFFAHNSTITKTPITIKIPSVSRVVVYSRSGYFLNRKLMSFDSSIRSMIGTTDGNDTFGEVRVAAM
jgi:hypothetical protein